MPDLRTLRQHPRFVLFHFSRALILVCFILAAQGCKPTQKSGYFGDVAEKQTKPKETARHYSRVISLSPAVTETIFLLGQQKRLVGTTEYSDYPPAAMKIPRVGGFAEPSIERIISLKPDLIISTDLKVHPTFARLKKLNLNLQDIETHNVANTMNMIRTVGKLLDVADLANERADKIEREINEIRDRHKNQKTKPRVYVEINYDPIFTVGGGSFINEMLGILGAKNVFGDNKGDYPQVSTESVVRANPDIILLGHGTFESDTLETVRKRPGWAGIAAVRNGRVYGDVHPDLYHRPGPRIVKGLLALEKRFYENSSEQPWRE